MTPAAAGPPDPVSRWPSLAPGAALQFRSAALTAIPSCRPCRLLRAAAGTCQHCASQRRGVGGSPPRRQPKLAPRAAAPEADEASLTTCVRLPHQTVPGRPRQKVPTFATATPLQLELRHWLVCHGGPGASGRPRRWIRYGHRPKAGSVQVNRSAATPVHL